MNASRPLSRRKRTKEPRTACLPPCHTHRAPRHDERGTTDKGDERRLLATGQAAPEAPNACDPARVPGGPLCSVRAANKRDAPPHPPTSQRTRGAQHLTMGSRRGGSAQKGGPPTTTTSGGSCDKHPGLNGAPPTLRSQGRGWKLWTRDASMCRRRFMIQRQTDRTTSPMHTQGHKSMATSGTSCSLPGSARCFVHTQRKHVSKARMLDSTSSRAKPTVKLCFWPVG